MTSNPILPGFNPDPSICRVGKDYYLTTSTFEYFPGLPIYHSRDLVNWKVIGHALNRPSQLNMRTTDPGGGIWAPTLRYHKGRWYMAACCVWKFGRLPVSSASCWTWKPY
jgi:beta-xylosidase